MTELHFLLLDKGHVEGDFSRFPKEVRWLQWRSLSLKNLPVKMCFLELAVLDLAEKHEIKAFLAQRLN